MKKIAAKWSFYTINHYKVVLRSENNGSYGKKAKNGCKVCCLKK